jgi:hypothetical protein
MNLLARFLPGLGPAFSALGALANPWILLGGLAIAVGVFLWGLHLGEAQLEAYQAKVEAAQRVADAERAVRIAARKEITTRRDARYARTLTALKARHADAVAGLERLLGASAGHLVPGAVPGAAPGGEGLGAAATVCFDPADLDRRLAAALRRFAQGSAAILQRGDAAGTGLDACAGWVIEQWQMKGAPKATN